MTRLAARVVASSLQRVRPPLSPACERWERVGSEEVEGLGERLGRLVG